MDVLIFFFFLIFFVFPLLKNISKNANKSKGKSANRYQKIAEQLRAEAQARMEQTNNGAPKAAKNREFGRRNNADGFPPEHQAQVRARQKRNQTERRHMQAATHSKKNRAMTKVGNRSRTDWGTRGDNGLTSSKGIVTALLLVLLAHLMISALFPGLIPGS